jgi:Tfp pilus assembly protein PilF
MKLWLAVLLTIVLGACTVASVSQRPVVLFHDDLFAPPTDLISVEDVFALSEEMQQYLQTEIAESIRSKGRQRGLYEALYKNRGLWLDYEDTFTRNAAQAFHDRTGNCLSLVIMTGAFARQIGLPVQYQDVLGSESWSRNSDLYLANGHMNISLLDGPAMTLDFLTPDEIRNQRRRVRSEQTVVAMYMNNRAIEALSAGQLDNAYWWTRAAITQDPKFLAAFNTLGVIYRRHANPEIAEQILSSIRMQEPGNIQILSNLAITLTDLGREKESRALKRQIEQIRLYPPFYFFDLGMAALKTNDFKSARTLFRKEIERDPYYHEFHYWLATAYVGLGELSDARKHLAIAIENSPTQSERDVYKVELARLEKITSN